MKTSVMIAGVCCLLALSFTLSECQNATCTINIDSDLQDCINDYADNPDNTDIVCADDCRSALEEYADDCLGTGAEHYKDALNEACNNGAINCETPTSEVSRCLDEYKTDPEKLLCGDCMSVLEDFADACYGNESTGRFQDVLDEVCKKRLCRDARDPNSELHKCIDEYSESVDHENADSLCGDCRSALEEYADACLNEAAGIFKNGLDKPCKNGPGAGSTVEAAALSTIISALVLAMVAVFN